MFSLSSALFLSKIEPAQIKILMPPLCATERELRRKIFGVDLLKLNTCIPTRHRRRIGTKRNYLSTSKLGGCRELRFWQVIKSFGDPEACGECWEVDTSLVKCLTDYPKIHVSCYSMPDFAFHRKIRFLGGLGRCFVQCHVNCLPFFLDEI